MAGVAGVAGVLERQLRTGQTAVDAHRRCALFFQEETRITQVADPWGGSYMMESLTQDMVDTASAIIDEVGSFSLVRVHETVAGIAVMTTTLSRGGVHELES